MALSPRDTWNLRVPLIKLPTAHSICETYLTTAVGSTGTYCPSLFILTSNSVFLNALVNKIKSHRPLNYICILVYFFFLTITEKNTCAALDWLLAGARARGKYGVKKLGEGHSGAGRSSVCCTRALTPPPVLFLRFFLTFRYDKSWRIAKSDDFSLVHMFFSSQRNFLSQEKKKNK